MVRIIYLPIPFCFQVFNILTTTEENASLSNVLIYRCFYFYFIESQKWNPWVKKYVWFFFTDISDSFPKMLYHSTVPPAMYEGTFLPHSH